MAQRSLSERLKKIVEGDVLDDAETRTLYSHDTSIFEMRPSVVVFPKHANDVAALVSFVKKAREEGEDISLTARAAGTDMTGGPLTSSIVMVFTKYMNHIREVGEDFAITEPGVYYRDFEAATLKKGLLMPSYPASREICAMGGIVNNNAGGERTLSYGKTERYVEEVSVTLSDGSTAVFGPQSMQELAQKKKQDTLEGEIYRRMHALIEEHYDEIMAAKPTVTKNSAGYALWNVFDKERGTFNLAKLIVGSQGTLAIMNEAKIKLIRPKAHRAMLIIFLSDLDPLPEIVERVLKEKPESFESYDDHTFTLALKFLPDIAKGMGGKRFLSLGFSFFSEGLMLARGGIPKLVLLAEFAEDTAKEAQAKANAARSALRSLNLRARIAKNENESRKYWIVRRESFNLLRKNLHGLHACPFIDDFVVHPKDLPTFLPELNVLLSKYKLTYTIAGHVGDANFHIIPLMDLSDPKARQIITELSPKVYELVIRYHGSTTGEHNDGLIRTPYLSLMFSPRMLELFARTKQTFDPLNIFNPGKKVMLVATDIKEHMMTHAA